MNRSHRALWAVVETACAVAALLCFGGCDRLKQPTTMAPQDSALIPPPVTDGKNPKAANRQTEGNPEAKTSSDSKDVPRDRTTPEAPPRPAKPVPYDPSRDVSLAQDNILEMERLLSRGRFSQMRPYLDELYSIVGYLEARQPRPLVHLTVRRAMLLIRKHDLEAAAGEIARARQELGMMTDPTAREVSALLAPAVSALAREDRQGAERALAQIHIDETPGDLASAAREVRSALASVDFDVSRQSARSLSLDLKDLNDAVNKMDAVLKASAKPPAVNQVDDAAKAPAVIKTDDAAKASKPPAANKVDDAAKASAKAPVTNKVDAASKTASKAASNSASKAQAKTKPPAATERGKVGQPKKQ